MLNSKEMARIAYDALDEKLGKDIRIIKIDEISVIADYLIIANGNNSPQITAMLDNVELKMHENGIDSKRIEGNKNSTWINHSGFLMKSCLYKCRLGSFQR